VFFTAPGFCTELMHTFLATDLTDASATADDDEEIEASWLTLDEALAAIDDGQVRDAKTLAGILWLARHLAGA
jgi:ADP-ribose pyrophosphatase